jgi:hypothetical protein
MYLIEIHLTITTERLRRCSLSSSRYQKGDHGHDRVKTASSDLVIVDTIARLVRNRVARRCHSAEDARRCRAK